MAQGQNARMVQISPEFFTQIDDFIAQNDMMLANMEWAIDKIIMGYAYVTVALAQKRSKGPLDPQQQNKAAAWLIPVRRITGNYYTGWKAERVMPKVWRVFNESREAYFVELGINHEGTGKESTGGRVRVRRPILKLSMLEAISFAQSTSFDMKAISSMWTIGVSRGAITNSIPGIAFSYMAGEA